MTTALQLHAKRAAVFAVVLLLAACAKNPVPAHPNQLNTFDGAMYDALITVQGSLNAAKAQVATTPALAKYKPELNQAIASYNAAQAAYKVYHTAGSNITDPALQTQVTALVSDVAKLLTALGVKL
jgi:hypothetical protein